MFARLLARDARGQESLWLGEFQEDIGERERPGPWISPRAQRSSLFGGKDGFVLALLPPQTRDLACDHEFRGRDIVRPGRESDAGVSPPRSAADPIRCGSAGSFQRAA